MYAENPLLSETLRTHHAEALQAIASPGDFFTGAERNEMVRVAREALDCQLCAQRRSSLSPYASPSATEGAHDGPGELDEAVVELIHRLRTDPGRITRAWFDAITQKISKQAYVEVVSVVASSVIVDTLHNAMGLGVPQLSPSRLGQPNKQYNEQAVEDGAWVPLLAVTPGPTETDQPQTWNITRALGLVPNALGLFFNTFRPHYALQDIALSLSQSQAEFIAARVSAINECFY
ncbi:MAG: hypothetical protein ACI9ON_000079 [Limisphaerales bacterium]|jgi:hypothetical protein